VPSRTRQLPGLKFTRILRDLSQRELSHRTNSTVAQPRISLIEQGCFATDDEANVLAAALSVDVARLERRPRPLRTPTQVEVNRVVISRELIPIGVRHDG